MSYPELFRIVRLVAVLVAGAVTVALSAFLKVPWFALGAMAVLFGLAGQVLWRKKCQQQDVVLAWSASVAVAPGVFLAEHLVFNFDVYFAAIAAGIALAMFCSGAALERTKLRGAWLLLGMTWATTAGFILVAAGYLANLPGQFYAGVGVIAGLLVVVKIIFRPSLLATQCINTLLLILIGLPLLDFVVRPSYELQGPPDARKRLYSYVEAKKNPTAFAHWWYYFVQEWRDTMQDICMPAINSPAPFRLRPGTEGMMFESRIHINQLGFRGPEIPAEKGDAYRILILGESTTFGHTIYEDDVPWPRVLERLIAQRLKPGRSVQVINAGVPSYTLFINLERLQRRLLALQPDMIISYHGYNAFDSLMPMVPPVWGRRPPEYETRPLKLLADAEYRLKVMAYRHEQTKPAPTTASTVPLMETPYARGYRQLIDLSRTNGIEVVLANYSMAVNTNSEMDVVTFYRAVFPHVLSQMRANQLHSDIVKRLATANSGVTFVNTHPRLDGQYEKFIDLVHFTQEGRQDMAEAMFEAIKPVLEREGLPSGG